MNEKCAVAAVFGTEKAASCLYDLLLSQQHRGLSASGIATSDSQPGFFINEGAGMVNNVHSEEKLKLLPGDRGIGHNRYPTSGDVNKTQPVYDGYLALAHNGNLPSTRKLENFAEEKGIERSGRNDTELMHAATSWYLKKGACLEDALAESAPLFTGAYSIVAMTKNKVAAMRDGCGIRPLSMGSILGATIFSSETCAMDKIDAENVQDVLPGELIVVDEQGIRKSQIQPSNQKLDIFEVIYFSRPDSLVFGKSISGIRDKLGRMLAIEQPVDADVVIPVLQSGAHSAAGYAEEAKLPYKEWLVRAPDSGRAFISSGNTRKEKIKAKFNPITDMIQGKRVALIDDSIVRGDTLPIIVDILRGAGARQVHVRISSPMVIFPDYYGIDTPSQYELIAFNRQIWQIQEKLGVDSLGYLSMAGLKLSLGVSPQLFNMSCLDGEYPLDIGERALEVSYPILAA